MEKETDRAGAAWLVLENNVYRGRFKKIQRNISTILTFLPTLQACFFLFFFAKMAIVNQEAIEKKTRSHLTNRNSYGKQKLSASSRIQKDIVILKSELSFQSILDQNFQGIHKFTQYNIIHFKISMRDCVTNNFQPVS